jgi:hypothetical protein
MQDLLIIAVPAATLACLYCCWRAGHLFLAWNPAAANVMHSDYDRLQQQDDFWRFGITIGSLRGWNWRDGNHGRLIHDEISFQDREGREQRATIDRRVRRGWRPYAVYTVWYDPADPQRVTAFGPGYWLMMAGVFAYMLVLLFAVGMKLTGR